MRKIVSFSTLILLSLPPGKAMTLYQMCAGAEAKPIKVNNPATIHGGNELIVKESDVEFEKKRASRFLQQIQLINQQV